ncbi:MAG: DUF116 domain-containing protein [Acidobacteriota bacterium]
MKEAKNTGEDGVNDRRLGDEWLEWEGNLSNYNGMIDEGKRTFLIFTFGIYFLLLIGSFLFLYLIYPRLYQLAEWLPKAALTALIAFFGLIMIWLVLTVMTVIMGRNFLLWFVRKSYLINLFFRISARLGEKLGISRDRMGNSFIKVSNALQKFICRISRGENLLILLPRCLEKDVRKKVQEICAKYNCKAFIASGGDVARKIIKEMKPVAIIGIACERDLVSGIEDTTPKIPVIGIENKRPEGPCKNTFIDVELFERTLMSLLNRKSDLSLQGR